MNYLADLMNWLFYVNDIKLPHTPVNTVWKEDLVRLCFWPHVLTVDRTLAAVSGFVCWCTHIVNLQQGWGSAGQMCSKTGKSLSN